MSAEGEHEKAIGKLESDRNRLFSALNGVLKDKEKLQEEGAEGTNVIEQLSAQLVKLEADIQKLTNISIPDRGRERRRGRGERTYISMT